MTSTPLGRVILFRYAFKRRNAVFNMMLLQIPLVVNLAEGPRNYFSSICHQKKVFTENESLLTKATF